MNEEVNKNRIPASVKVGPHVIDIFQTPEISEYFGKYHYARNLIELTVDGVHESIIGDTLIHEILHAIWKMSQINQMMELPDEYTEDDIEAREEAMVHVLGAQIFQLMRDNPKLVEFIMQK